MKTATKTLTLALLAIGLTACDRGLTEAQQAERSEARYQKAMTSYKAGNLESAVRELEDVLRSAPGNLSARFLLASLQQERKDALGAYCNFREFTFLAPAGEKADMARRRMALCEEDLAKTLAKKMKLTGNDALAREGESARQELKAADAAQAKLATALAAAERRAAALERENARLRRMVGEVGGAEEPEDGAARRPATLRDILDDDEEGAPAPRVQARDAADDAAETEPASGIAAAKELLSDADGAAGPAALPAREGGAAASGRLTDLAGGGGLPFGRGRDKAPKDDAASRAKRPESYVVQEGDTLYKIALRFYGNQNQWRRIREANKATISNDGRVNAGQKIILP